MRTKGQVIADYDGYVYPAERDGHGSIANCIHNARLGTECKANSDFIAAAWNACHRLGLTAEQLDAGVIEKVVESLRDFERFFREHLSLLTPLESQALAKAQSALRPFTKESRDDSNI